MSYAPSMDWGSYPDNYDFLTDDEKNEILEYLNGPDDYNERFSEERRRYANDLQDRGIAVRWNWAGDRNKWILVDQFRAEMEWDWRWQCSE